MPANKAHMHKRMAITMKTEEVRYHVNFFYSRNTHLFLLGYEDEYYGDQYYGSLWFERIVGNYR